MRVTIIYDNTSFREDLRADWGFSALVDGGGRRILFDAGARGDILLGNMRALSIDPRSIQEVFISHPHADHVGGLSDLLRINPVRVVVPRSAPAPRRAEVLRVGGPAEIHPGIYSTGELAGIEQSMAVDSEIGLVVISGCAHPGVGKILEVPPDSEKSGVSSAAFTASPTWISSRISSWSAPPTAPFTALRS
ncbi:MAG TPA: MBL fold metallo-hydrolase [Methanothrix sp.]|nr:MBL fold metallo-hydrolase [Methanothrix sp.]